MLTDSDIHTQHLLAALCQWYTVGTAYIKSCFSVLLKWFFERGGLSLNTLIQDKINLISIFLVWKTLRVIPAGRRFVFHWPILHCWLVCIFHWKYQGQNLGKWPTNSWTADQKEKRNNEDKHNFIAILKTCLEAFIWNWLIVVLGIWKKSKPNQKMALFFLNSFQTKSHSRFTAQLTLTHTRPKNGTHEVPNILLLTLSSCSYWGGTPHFCCQKGQDMFEIAFFHSVLISKTF